MDDRGEGTIKAEEGTIVPEGEGKGGGTRSTGALAGPVMMGCARSDDVGSVVVMMGGILSRWGGRLRGVSDERRAVQERVGLRCSSMEEEYTAKERLDNG
jgi:hypothetical protein